MYKTLLIKEYPSLSEKDINKVNNAIFKKCSEYYFIDFLTTTNGNVEDAIGFFYLDEKLRTLLIQYLVRFEIQVKSDFARMAEKETKSSKFWEVNKYYHPNARAKRTGQRSYCYLTKKNIQNSINKMRFNTIGPLNYVAMYSIPFGCFKTLFRHIDIPYKQPFINEYTSHLKVNTFDVLYLYFECIRLLRNRCAHGNHIITLKFKNCLNEYKNLVTNKTITPIPGSYVSVFEAILIFLIKQLNCGKEFKNNLINLLQKRDCQKLLKKYIGKHSLSLDTVKNLFNV